MQQLVNSKKEIENVVLKMTALCLDLSVKRITPYKKIVAGHKNTKGIVTNEHNQI